MYRNDEPPSNSYDDADDEFITANDLNGHNSNPQGPINIKKHSTNHNTSATTTSNNTSSSSFYDRQYQQYLSDSQSKDSQDYEDEHNMNMSMGMGMGMTAMKDDIYDDDEEEPDEGIETITLEYDMGLTSHSSTTKLCSRWCRRSFCVYNCFCRKIITLFSKCGILCCKKPTEEIGDGLEDKPSNEELLSIAFLSFLVFTMCQGVAAYFAKSEAMMGDSIAMAVDAFTYGFNLIAERMKGNPSYTIPFLKINRYDDDDDDNDDRMSGRQLSEKQREHIQKRCKRKQKLVLELVPPIISVTTLFFVTIIILHGSISVLVLDSHRDASQQTRPNVVIMFAFSLLNLVVDGVNILFFSKADHAFGYDTVEAEAGSGYNYDGDGYDVDGDNDGDGYSVDGDGDGDDDHNSDANHGDDANLNGGDNVGRGRGRSQDGIEIRPSTSSSSMNMKGAQGLNANYTSTHPSPRTGKDAKKEIADSLKLIMREKRRRKGGAYAQINNTDLSYEYDDDDDDDHDDNVNKNDENRNVYNGNNAHFDKDEQDTHNPLDFSIDEGDEDNDGHDMNRHRIHGDGNGNGHGSAGSSPLHHQIPSIHSIDEEDAEHHLAIYEAEKGQANLNMVSNSITRLQCGLCCIYPHAQPIFISAKSLNDIFILVYNAHIRKMK